MFKVQELYDGFKFINACKANYYPDINVSLDEAVKKSKGVASLTLSWDDRLICAHETQVEFGAAECVRLSYLAFLTNSRESSSELN
jgi:hypothetical protein